MTTEKHNGKTQAQNPVESSDLFGNPKFITQKSLVPRSQPKRSDGRSLCRDENASNLPAKNAKHTKRICVHLRASAVKKNPPLNATCARRRTTKLTDRHERTHERETPRQITRRNWRFGAAQCYPPMHKKGHMKAGITYGE